jgi:hypothetical protein
MRARVIAICTHTLFSNSYRKEETTIITSTVFSINKFSLIFRGLFFSTGVNSNVFQEFVIFWFDVFNSGIFFLFNDRAGGGWRIGSGGWFAYI